jgi:hypothetical protein
MKTFHGCGHAARIAAADAFSGASCKAGQCIALRGNRIKALLPVKHF